MKSATPASDIDIAIDATEDISWELSLMRESLAESTIPYKVDLVNLKTTSAEFRQQVNEEGILIWKN